MDVVAVLREYLWLWVICGVVFASGLVALVFFFINKCISRAGKHRISQLQRRDHPSVHNKYQETSPSRLTPPLPPRTQFIAEGQSYENLAETAESDGMYEQNVNDYEEVDQDLPVYQQGLEDQFDYVKVEAEEKEVTFPPPPSPSLLSNPYQEPDVTDDNASTEDYDDIGPEEEEEEEDYDDVG